MCSCTSKSTNQRPAFLQAATKKLMLITQGEKRETSTKTCNETMLRDKLHIRLERYQPYYTPHIKPRPTISSPDQPYQAPENSRISQSYLTLFGLRTVSKSHEQFDDQQNENKFLIPKRLCFIFYHHIRYRLATSLGVTSAP